MYVEPVFSRDRSARPPAMRSSRVDEELLALDMRGIVGGEEQHRLRDMFGLT